MRSVTVRVHDELFYKFKAMCEADYKSTSEVIRQLMLDYVRENQKEETKMKIKYDGEVIGEVTTNMSLTLDEALRLIEIDPHEEEGGEQKYDYELFEMEY